MLLAPLWRRSHEESQRLVVCFPDAQLPSEVEDGCCSKLARIAQKLVVYPPSVDEGHIAYLRLIREIRDHQISRTPVEEMRAKGSLVARRIARLSLIYLHRLTQKTAMVFTDIGLPTEYENNHGRTVADNITKWVDDLSRPGKDGSP